MRKDYGKNNRCNMCGEYFNYLGIASHRAACRRKKLIKCPACGGSGEQPSNSLDCDVRDCFLCSGEGKISQYTLNDFRQAQSGT